MKRNSRKTDLSSRRLPPDTEGNESSARLPWNYSPPVLQVKGAEDFQFVYSNDVNLTIRLRVNEFTRKQATIITGQVLYQVATEGITIGDWMTLEFLYSYLLGQKRESLELKNFKELELTLLLKVVLLSGTFIGLEGRKEIPEDISTLVLASRWIPNRRTYFSRISQYRIDKFLEVRIVPIDNLIERTKGNIRYSSYCKGYGESSHMGRRQKTRSSAELDGLPVDLERDQTVRLDLFNLSTVMSLVLAEIKYSSQRK
jgi:hypothetical protein